MSDNNLLQTNITISTPGKLMLMGEHAVVYGRPCLVTAVGERMKVTVETLDEQIFKLEASDVKISGYQKLLSEIGRGEIPKEVKFIETALRNFMDRYKIQKGVLVTVKSDFSADSGFGSSSAVTVGVIKALTEVFQIKLTPRELFNLAYKTVLDVQGKGSGFDVAAAIYGGTIHFKNGGEIIDHLPIDNLNLVVGYSGIKTDTVSMVNLVAEKRKNYKEGIEKIFDNIGKLVDEAKMVIIDKDWERVGTLMDYNQNYLEDLGVSTDKLNLMIEAAKKAGAFGAKISGAGGGDCMIALVSSENKIKVGKAIADVGGEIINVNINTPGVRVENLCPVEKFRTKRSINYDS